MFSTVLALLACANSPDVASQVTDSTFACDTQVGDAVSICYDSTAFDTLDMAQMDLGVTLTITPTVVVASNNFTAENLVGPGVIVGTQEFSGTADGDEHAIPAGDEYDPDLCAAMDTWFNGQPIWGTILNPSEDIQENVHASLECTPAFGHPSYHVQYDYGRQNIMDLWYVQSGSDIHMLSTATQFGDYDVLTDDEVDDIIIRWNEIVEHVTVN